MAQVISFNAMNPLLGTWKCCDGFSDVEFIIEAKSGNLVVSGIDRHDGEVAEIRDVVWSVEDSVLTFSAYWASSGRFTKYRFRNAVKAGRADVTYTYTAQEVWEKV